MASYREKVLGASTSTLPQIPSTIEGPGLILPDSPLFFLDQIKQTVRVATAFTPEQKAKVYKDIAGERLAELRFMLAKNNRSATNTALNGVAENLKKAGEQVDQAQLRGANVSSLAKTINDDIKLKQQSLDLLENQAQGEMKGRVTAAQEALMVAKVKIEDALPEQELENEIDYDLRRQIQRRVTVASQSAQETQEELKELTAQTKQTSNESLRRRQEALQKAIEEKNQILQREQEQLLKYEKEKNTELMELETKEAQQVIETVKQAKEAALKYQNVQRSIDQLKNKPATAIKVAPTPTPKPSTAE